MPTLTGQRRIRLLYEEYIHLKALSEVGVTVCCVESSFQDHACKHEFASARACLALRVVEFKLHADRAAALVSPRT